MSALPARRHLLAIGDLDIAQIDRLFSRAEAFITGGDDGPALRHRLAGATLVNLFYENSTRTQSSFELAARRLGADVINMSPRTSSVAKGETLLDTAATLNAMGPDLLVIRHPASGAALLLSRKVTCAVINAGDGRHEHPTQALLDALTLRRTFGNIEGLRVAICGDSIHSRVARSNVALLTLLGAEVRLVGPPTLAPKAAEDWGVTVFHDMREGLKGANVVMMLRLQSERMDGAFIPSPREFFRFYGLDAEKLAWAAPGARVMHPGPMNRGVEIESGVADLEPRSLIETQVRTGVALRMAVLEDLASTVEGISAPREAH